MKNKIIITLILITSIFLANYNLNSRKALSYKINEVFPYKFYEWKGKDIKADKVTYSFIDPEELLFRNYEYQGKKINLTIVLTNKRDHIHDPQVCYRGQGIDMNNQKRIIFGKNISAYWVSAKRKDTPYKLIYWYSDLKRTYSSRTEFMKHIIISNILNKPADSYVLVSVSGTNIDEKELKDFAGQVNDRLYETAKK